MTTDSNTLLTADDYSYRLPDHWLLDRDSATGHFPILHRAYVRRVVELVARSNARSVIEIGCGDGWNCGQLAEAGFDVVGVDWSSNGIAHATRLVPGGRFFCGDIRSAQFRERFPEPFDAAIFVEVLEHIPPPDCAAVLRNIAGTLRDGGTLILTTPSVNQPNTNPQHYRHFSEAALRGLIAGVNELEIRSIEGYGDMPYQRQLYRRLRLVENRYYSIKPLRKRILEGYRAYCLERPLDRCAGFIVTLQKTTHGSRRLGDSR